MTFEIALAFLILLGGLLLLALERFPADFVALALMGLILVLGPVVGVSAEQAISGFSNPATITVFAMFILSGAVYHTGLINLMAQKMVRLAGPSDIRQLVLVMLVVGPISAFINNTAAVAILVPSVITLAREHHRAPSKLLMPLSYFSQLAGVVTLIGTSTNILASNLSQRLGYGAFGMFEFAPIGLLVFCTGAVYILTLGRLLLPGRPFEDEITSRYRMKEYLSEVVVLQGSRLVGKTVAESRLREQFDIHIFEIRRAGQKLEHPLADKRLLPGDILFVNTNTEKLLKINNVEGLAVQPEVRFAKSDLKHEHRRLLEVVIGPSSDLIGGTIADTNFHYRYNCTVIAIRKHGELIGRQQGLIRERLGNVRLGFGDTLLLRGATLALEQIKRDPDFIVTEELQLKSFRTEKALLAAAILAGVVAIAALGIPILVTSIVGCVLMVVSGCLKVNELHESIRWDVILLLAGVIPLGLTLENTGAADLLAALATKTADHVPPIVVLSAFYAITMLLTELISNNAAVVLMIPVASASAKAVALEPRALFLAIMFAASTSFSTPVGYQTNTMVYGPGGYRFLDFLRVGGPLNVLLAVATPIYIYYLWGI